MSRNNILIYAGIVFTMFLWGLTFVFFKIAFESFNPISIIFIRLIISSILLFIFSIVTGKMQKMRRGDLRLFIVLAFFEPFIYFMGESYGLVYVSSTLAAIIISLIPLVVPVVAYFIYGEKLSGINIAGLFISFVGVLLVVVSNGIKVGSTILGIFLMFVAVLGAVGYAITVKDLTQRYNGFTITCYQNVIGVGFFLPFFLIIDLQDFNMNISLNSALAVVYLAVFGSTVTFVIFTRAIRELGASRSNIFANLIPVFAAVFSWLILKESMTALKIAGIAVVLSGLILSQVKTIRLRKQKFPTSPIYQYPP